MKTNYHTHTTRCMHATGDDEDYVLSAIKGGYRILGFSDHTPWKYRTDYVADMRMLPEELPGYVKSLKTLREKYHDRIDIRIGLECEYFPQYIHWLKEQIKKYQLDYIIFGNHHYHTDEKFPYFGHHTNSRDMLDLYEESAIEGMESGLFSCLAHPDLFMRSYPKFDHHCTTISWHICRTAARLNVPLEYNIGYVAYNEALLYRFGQTRIRRRWHYAGRIRSARHNRSIFLPDRSKQQGTDSAIQLPVYRPQPREIE